MLDIKSFVYRLKVDGPKAIFPDDEINSKLDKCHELIIDSVPFASFGECETQLTKLLGIINGVISKDGTQHIIVSQVNPNLKADAKDYNDKWDKTIIARFYLADVQKLKTQTLEYKIVADVMVDQDTINAVQHLMSKNQQ